MTMFKMMRIAQEWANELAKLEGNDLNADLITAAFNEVERGRNPDTVLKELIARINDNQKNVPLPGVQSPDRSHTLQ